MLVKVAAIKQLTFCQDREDGMCQGKSHKTDSHAVKAECRIGETLIKETAIKYIHQLSRQREDR
jgi:hypothetical protein